MDVPVAFLDQQRVLDTEIELCVNSRVAGILRDGHQTIDLNAVTAAYLRPYDVRRLPVIESAGPGSPAWRHALAIEEALWSWAELT
jgi:hypothetical protein